VPDAAVIAYVRPLVEKASLALCVNEAWALLAGFALLGMILVLLTREAAQSQQQPLVARETRHPGPRRLDQVGP
jgi:MFS transporter, DHA2 family, multidrug resistance protein